ncbi:Steroid 5-alpha reductase family enzyme [Frankineae bacterium MT45]|nr:Steroid 5-alpha reductase family enzyme [Frankineae bacterium MT45]
MGTVSWVTLVVCLVASAATIVVLMGVTMAISMRTNNWSVVDTFWGLGFVAIAVVSYLITIDHGDAGRRLIALLVTAIWGLRLAGYIHWRNHGKPEDPRYTALMKRRTGPLIPYVVKNIFWAQGWVMWVVAIPISVAMVEHQPVNALTWLGVALAAVGLFFEAVGDAQLARFKSDPANAGKLMDKGLWGWTRHPNYFGDICVMFGIWIVACGSWIGVVTVFAPILMARMLISKSGKALLERRMARSRGPEYAEYVARTSGLIPRPPRKHASTHLG